MQKNIFSEIHATSMYISNINSIRDLLEDPVSSHHVSNFFLFFFTNHNLPWIAESLIFESGVAVFRFGRII